jgi:hypothetical protein
MMLRCVASICLLCACSTKTNPAVDASTSDASAKDEWKTWPFRALDIDERRPPRPEPPQPSAEELAVRKVAHDALDWAKYSELAWIDPQARLQNGVAAALRAYHQRPTLVEWPPFADALTLLAAGISSLDYTAPPQRIFRPLTVFAGHTGPVNLARFSPDGERVLTASADSTARLWDAATGRELVRYTGHTASVQYAAFSPDCQRIVTTGRPWQQILSRGPPLGVRFNGRPGAHLAIHGASEPADDLRAC